MCTIEWRRHRVRQRLRDSSGSHCQTRVACRGVDVNQTTVGSSGQIKRCTQFNGLQAACQAWEHPHTPPKPPSALAVDGGEHLVRSPDRHKYVQFSIAIDIQGDPSGTIRKNTSDSRTGSATFAALDWNLGSQIYRLLLPRTSDYEQHHRILTSTVHQEPRTSGRSGPKFPPSHEQDDGMAGPRECRRGGGIRNWNRSFHRDDSGFDQSGLPILRY